MVEEIFSCLPCAMAFSCCKFCYRHLSHPPHRAFSTNLNSPHWELCCFCSWHIQDLPPTLGILGLCSLQVLSWLQTCANTEQHFKLFEQLWPVPKIWVIKCFMWCMSEECNLRSTQKHVDAFLKARRWRYLAQSSKQFVGSGSYLSFWKMTNMVTILNNSEKKKNPNRAPYSFPYLI